MAMANPTGNDMSQMSNMGPSAPRWGAARRGLPAWLMSMALHATMLVIVAYSLQFTARGVSVEPSRTAGIVLVKSEDGKREYSDESERTPVTQGVVSAVLRQSQVLPQESENPIDLTGVLPDSLDSLGASAGSSLPSAGDLTAGGGTKPHDGGQTRTEVFGIPGEGTKFVYVFDRSGSMDGFGGRPLQAAKSELLASLQDLDRIHQFQIIFYNESPRVFNPHGGSPELAWGDESTKELAARFIRGITADGATQHMDALRLALGMRPDVIFFLTDADEPQLTPDELNRIRRLNRGSSINAIEFGFGPRRRRANFLVRLAGQNGGRHAYVDVSQLRRKS